MELKSLILAKWLKMNSFNRTFMELKYRGYSLSVMQGDGFNRTFMELKYRGYSLSVMQGDGFNRTFMELK